MRHHASDIQLEVGRKCLELYRNRNIPITHLSRRFGVARSTVKRWMRKAEMYESKSRQDD